MKKNRITFVFPRTQYVSGDPPLGVAYLAAVLRRAHPDFEIQILDGTFLKSESRLFSELERLSPDVVAVTTDSSMIGIANRIGTFAQRRGSVAIAGGPMATVRPELFTASFDAVLMGQGECSIVELVERALDGRSLDEMANVVTKSSTVEEKSPDHPGSSLDDLPFPAWDLLDMERYVRLWPYLDAEDMEIGGTNIVASRGCPWKCTYCQPTLRTLFGSRILRRSSENIIAEITELRERYGIKGIFFHDDTLTSNRKWLIDLCQKISELPFDLMWGCNSRVDVLTPELIDTMVASGMKSVHLGIESGSERIRREVLKKSVDLDHLNRVLDRLRFHDAHALGFFMLGSPTESLSEMFETLKLARRLPLQEATFSITSAIPGTDLYDHISEHNRFTFVNEQKIDYYNSRNFEDQESLWGNETLRIIQFYGLARFYLSPLRVGYLLNHFRSQKGLRKFLFKSERFLSPFLRFLSKSS